MLFRISTPKFSSTSEGHMLSLEVERLSPYRSSIRGTWREGSYAEDSWRHVMEGSGNTALLL